MRFNSRNYDAGRGLKWNHQQCNGDSGAYHYAHINAFKKYVTLLLALVAIVAVAPATGQVVNSQFQQSFDGAIARTFTDKARDFVNAKDAGVKCDGSTNDAPKLQAIINAFPSGNVEIRLPRGNCLITSQVTIDKDRVNLVGAGAWATSIICNPTANITCLYIGKKSTVIWQGSVRGIAFITSDATYTKVAINLVDASTYAFDDVAIYHWVGGTGSTGIQINGREDSWFRNITIDSDKPIVIGPILAPHRAAGIGIDHFNFHNLYLIGRAGHPLVTMQSGLYLTQVSFTGAQAWVHGSHGLYWADTTSVGVSNGLVLENVRWEQGTDTTAYMVYIAHNYQLQGLQIRGGQGGGRRGFYLRNVADVSIDSFYYTSAKLEAFNVDSTVKRITFRNVFWQAGSTASVSGQRTIFATPKNPNTGALPPNAIYDESSNALNTITMGGALDVGGNVTLHNSATLDAPRLVVNAAASPTSNEACTAGRIVWDVAYIYVCTAPGAWKRAALMGGY